MSERAPNADEVDRIVAAWGRERGDLDVAPLRVFSRVDRLARLLARDRAAALAGHAVAQWEFDGLAALRRAGVPFTLSAGALQRETLVSSATMTHRVDRLTARGWVRRRPDPGDRRGVLVSLTDAGRAVVDAALADLLEAERALLAPLSARDAETLGDLLRTLLGPLE